MKNVSKLSSENISDLKKSYLTGLGISEPAPEGADLPPVSSWIVFDGKDANSYRAGAYRVTYTGGTGAHRADRMIIDYVNVAKVLGLDVSRIVVETADKDLSKRLTALGAKVAQSTDGVKNDDGDVILRAKMTVAMSFCIALSDEYDIIVACF